MKKIFLLIIFLKCILVYGQMAEVLTNFEVIEMATAGLDDETIINKVRNTEKSAFDVTTSGLIQLKKGSVSEKVINFLINHKQAVNETDFNLRNVGNVDIRRLGGSGIFWIRDQEMKSYKKLDATLVTGGVFKSGIFRVTQKSSLAGKTSNIPINTNEPKFYFYFDPSATTLNSDENYFQFLNTIRSGAMATTPNDFKLVKLVSRNGLRTFMNVKDKVVGYETGIDGKSIIPFTYEQIAPNLYELSLQSKLGNGEYCFYYNINSMAGNTNNLDYRLNQMGVRVFDFVISGTNNIDTSPKKVTYSDLGTSNSGIQKWNASVPILQDDNMRLIFYSPFYHIEWIEIKDLEGKLIARFKPSKPIQKMQWEYSLTEYHKNKTLKIEAKADEGKVVVINVIKNKKKVFSTAGTNHVILTLN